LCVGIIGLLAAMGCRSEGITGPEYGDPSVGGTTPGVGPTADAGMTVSIVDLATIPDLPPAGGGPCGGKLGQTCNAATEVCVIEAALVSNTGHCRPVPAACGSLNARDCSCLDSMCTGQNSLCIDANTPNTILCECPNC
jgi:hypothetical protein